MAATPRYFKVPNLDEFQHYGNRNNTWMKLYYRILSDQKFAGLSDAQKWQMVGIWLVACQNNNRLAYDPADIKALTRSKSRVDLDALLAAGFIADADGSSPPCLEDVASKAASKGGKQQSLGSTASDKREEKRRVREEKNTGASAPVPPRERNPLYDAIAAAFYPSGVPSGKTSLVGMAAAELKRLGAKPEQVASRAVRCRQMFEGKPITPRALVDHWDSLRPDAATTATAPCTEAEADEAFAAGEADDDQL